MTTPSNPFNKARRTSKVQTFTVFLVAKLVKLLDIPILKPMLIRVLHGGKILFSVRNYVRKKYVKTSLASYDSVSLSTILYILSFIDSSNFHIPYFVFDRVLGES